MKFYFFFILSVLSLQVLQAQKIEARTPSSTASQMYFEFGGAGILYSLNYDTRFLRKENGLGGRVGIGIISVDETTFSAIPLGLNYLFGNDGKYFEVGAGISFLSYKESSDVDLFNGSANTGYLQIGFRNQPNKTGFTWRAIFSPFFGAKYFVPSGGVSIGYRF